jgi:hypothetical protein
MSLPKSGAVRPGDDLRPGVVKLDRPPLLGGRFATRSLVPHSHENEHDYEHYEHDHRQ